ncbi:response regulator [Actinoplanes sp. NEAU-A12]|uniref:Response regulator n=1 Tax=Actinoplanes sandaracinus TaxID=3045177 RepID=A0ABT6WY54_9ACTN|nr:response regulator [Actinoplanes sandaracinus]MDI6104668.1 response regulator [Actinoplanes sandaracinus]
MTTVMLVDDSATMLMSLESILTKAGYAAETAGHGKEALDKLSKGLAIAQVAEHLGWRNPAGGLAVSYTRTGSSPPT